MKQAHDKEGILFHFGDLFLASSPLFLINPLKLPGVPDK